MQKNTFIDILLRNRSKCLIAIVYTLLALIYCSGLHQKLYRSVDHRIKFHAVPIAISTLYQGHPHDYRGWLSTERPFQNYEQYLTNAFLKEQINAPVNKEAGHYYWVADDRGYADFTIGAFALFGPSLKSLYKFWFLILFVSVSLFVMSFHKEIWTIAILALILLGMHSSISLLKLIHVQVPIYEPRYLDVLALVAVYHMIVTAVSVKRENLKLHFIPLCCQILIFTFLYHARSSLGWEIVAVMGTSLVVIFLKREAKKISTPLIVIALLTGSLVALNSYKHLVYHKSYFDNNNGVRTFWHNALMGLNIKGNQSAIDDFAVAKWVIEYANETKACASCVEKLEAQGLLNSLGNWGEADWVSYEKCARKLYFSVVLQHKWEVATLYFFRKPSLLLKELMSPSIKLFQGEKASQTLENSITWNPLNFIYLIPFIGILFFALDSIYFHRIRIIGILSGLFIAAMIPSVAFYSDILTHGGLSAIFPVLCYVGISLLYRKYEKLRTLHKYAEV